MKNLSINQIMSIAKCGYSTAYEFKSKQFIEGKLYLHQKNYATHTLNWLTKVCKVSDFKSGNDAPKGGKNGDFVTFIPSIEFLNIVENLLIQDEKIGEFQQAINEEKSNKLESFQPTEKMILDFKAKTKGLSNKKARKVAHNMAAKYLGFYSTEGMSKLFNS